MLKSRRANLFYIEKFAYFPCDVLDILPLITVLRQNIFKTFWYLNHPMLRYKMNFLKSCFLICLLKCSLT